MSFNEKLQKLRKQQGLSQEALADLLDVTRQSVSKWESGTTYPEMDKLLAICKIFKCSLDDLTNDEIKEVRIEEKKKSNIYTLIDSILEFLKETEYVIKHMTKQEKATCIVVMGITALILLLAGIPFIYIKDFFYYTIHSTENDLFIIGSNFINFVINCCYWSLFLSIFIYVFKSVYLDAPKYKIKEMKKETKVEENESMEMKIEKKQPKKATNRIDTLFRILEKIVLFFGKMCICFIILPTIFILFFLCAALFIYLYLLFKGVFYLSILIGIPFAILLVLTILEVLICFVIKRNANEKRLMITFIASIIGLGSAFGILLLDISSIEYVNEIPKEVKITTTKREYEMKEDLYFLFSNMSEYEIDNTLENKVRVEVDYYEDYIEVLLPPSVNSPMPYREKSYTIMNKHLLSIMMENLKNRKIYDYSKLNSVNIRIYASEKSIETLKQNYKKEIEKIEELRKAEQDLESQEKIDHYFSRIEELEREKNELNIETTELHNQISQLQTEIEEYQRKLERLQSIIEE